MQKLQKILLLRKSSNNTSVSIELTKKIVKQNFRIKYLPVGEKRTITCLSSSVVYDMTVTTRIHSVM